MFKIGQSRLTDFDYESSGAQQPGQINSMAVSALALVAGVWFLSWAKGLLIPVTLAVFLAICLRPAVNALCRLYVPRSVGAALVLIALCAVIGFGVGRLRDGSDKILDELPAASQYLHREINRTMNDPSGFAHRLKMLTDLPGNGVVAVKGSAAAAVTASSASDAASGAQSAFSDGTRRVMAMTSEAAAVLFLIYLMLASGGQLHRLALGSVALPAQLRRLTQPTVSEIARQLRRYLGLLCITNIALGLTIWISFRLFGIANAGVWGVAAGILHFVPYVGPAVIAAGSGLLASVQFESLARGLIVAATTLAVSAAIGVALTTWLAGRTARMNTIAVFVSLLFWSWLWGLPGLLLGTPVTMALKVVCSKCARLNWLDALMNEFPPQPTVAARRSILRTIQRVYPS